MRAKPFLKWAGGKTQLINKIESQLPLNIIKNEFIFVEPFVGSGAVLFWMIEAFPNMKKAVINDVNVDLINCYITIREEVEDLIKHLFILEQEYHSLLDNQEAKKTYFYEKRLLFNSRTSKKTLQSALFIFLNKTCFNGLYRVNRKNEFNVPIGSYKKPTICDVENLRKVSIALEKVILLHGDYTNTIEHISEHTLFYFDPPYKPLSQTSSFNSYTKGCFDDDEQIRLANFCEKLDKLGHKWILSNSDVKGKDPKNDFFDDLYAKFTIKRVNARRSINANASKRGQLTELLISN